MFRFYISRKYHKHPCKLVSSEGAVVAEEFASRKLKLASLEQPLLIEYFIGANVVIDTYVK